MSSLWVGVPDTGSSMVPRSANTSSNYSPTPDFLNQGFHWRANQTLKQELFFRRRGKSCLFPNHGAQLFCFSRPTCARLSQGPVLRQRISSEFNRLTLL